MHALDPRDAARGDAGRARHRGVVRSRALRRRLQLQRLADREGRDVAAGVAGSRADRRRRRWSTRCCSAASSARSCRRRSTSGIGILPWSPLGRGVLTGKYRTGTPADSRGASPDYQRFVAPYLDDRARRVVGAVHHRRRRTRRLAARGRAGLGARPARRRRPDRRRAHRCAAQGLARRRRDSCCPRRSATRSTTCRCPRWVIPKAGIRR